jgi:hypothetical protein
VQKKTHVVLSQKLPQNYRRNTCSFETFATNSRHDHRYRSHGRSNRICPRLDRPSVLDQHRTAALLPSTANGNSEADGENVPGTLEQTA